MSDEIYPLDLDRDEDPSVDTDEIFGARTGEDDDVEDEDAYVSEPTLDEIQQLSIATTDWTVEALTSLYNRGQLEMDPSFQRRSAWDRPKRTRFIESLILSLPIPPVVLAETIQSGSRRYIVLDGKQRLSTIFAFVSNQLRLPKMPADENDLILTDLENKYFSDHEQSISQEYRDQLLTSTIRTVVVRSWNRPDLLSLIFLRLNTGTKPLSAQELRRALLPGPFIDWIYQRSEASTAVQKTVGASTSKPHSRMADIELTLRFFGFALSAPAYGGNMKALLDEAVRRGNEELSSDGSAEARTRYESLFETLEGALVDCAAALDGKIRIWNSSRKHWESRFNRAAMDVLASSYRTPDVREFVRGRPAEFRELFKQYCSDQDVFVSLTTTTKSVHNTRLRFSRWAEIVSTHLGVSVETPNWK